MPTSPCFPVFTGGCGAYRGERGAYRGECGAYRGQRSCVAALGLAKQSHKAASRENLVGSQAAACKTLLAVEHCMAYPVDVGGKLASEDEAVNALLQARDVHDLQEVALHSAQLLRVTQAFVLRVLTLQI